MNFPLWFSLFLFASFDDVTKQAPYLASQLLAQQLQNDPSLLSNGSVLLFQTADLLLQPLVLELSLLQCSFLIHNGVDEFRKIEEPPEGLSKERGLWWWAQGW